MIVIDKTLDYLREVLSKSNKPILMCSFGKDSMVLLHLVRQMENVPIIFFKEPFFPKKYAFANMVIEDWNLTVYDYPPFATNTVARNGTFEVINYYNLRDNVIFYLPTGIERRKEGETFACSRLDFLNKPTVKDYYFPWDLILIGHKSSDSCPIFGEVPLKAETIEYPSFSCAMPLKNWTDKDIWNYIGENDVPYNEKRYDKEKGYKEFSDRTYNNDYYPACYECLDPHNSGDVFCPILNRNIQHNGESLDRHAEKISFHRNLMTNLAQV